MMLRPATCLLLPLIIGLNLPGAAQAQDADAGLGRLFHSSQQRSILDELRRRNAQINPEQQAESISLQGIVRRSDGASTVWINGRAHHDRAPVAALGQRSARVFVGDGKTRELKVGEEIRLTPSGATP